MFVSVLTLAFALAADAFAVSLAQGMAARAHPHRTALVLGGAFGAAQGLMPLIGWGAGRVLTPAIAAYDHWVAFTVLAILGARLLFEAAQRGEGEAVKPALGWGVAALALATSIDAAGAGLALDAMAVGPFAAAATIGIVTALVCAGGVYLGRIAGARLGKAAEFAGGIALIAIGVRILVEHGALG